MRLIAWLVVLLAGAVVLWPLMLRLAHPGDPDGIDFARWYRRAIYQFGFDLPGTPDLDHLEGRLAAQGLKRGAPVFVRIFKRDFELELWMQQGPAEGGQAGAVFQRFATYPICRFSGDLGPKITTGDKQAPEGVYTVEAGQLNPESRWHKAFNLGFPNAYDRAKGRTGSLLMVHGGCSSVGCYAMTNAVIDEVYALVSAALSAGQHRFQVQVLPFRLSAGNLAARAGHPAAAFWADLKPGYDLFERDHVPPKVSVCNGRYAFAPGAAGSMGALPIGPACLSAAEDGHPAERTR
jgi:murein L,D-transpeptidase YafK